MEFRPGRPVVTETPIVVVDPGLPPGRHRFQLKVVGEGGRRSKPAHLVVTVLPERDDPR
jgi:hypothetical protein